MSIATTAPEKFDFQDLVCVELILRFGGDTNATMHIEPLIGEDAELRLSAQCTSPTIVEVQVKGAASTITLDSIAECLAHFPPRKSIDCLLERLIASPSRIILLVMSARCDDTASIFAATSNWNGAPLPSGRIKITDASAFLSAFGNINISPTSRLKAARKAYCELIAKRITPAMARAALERVVVLERVTESDLEAMCDRHLRTNHRVPSDRIPDVINRLRNTIKQAKAKKVDAFSLARVVLTETAPVSIRPAEYVERGIEVRLIASLSSDKALLLSGPPRCGKSDMARWIAAEFEQLGYEVRDGVDVEAASRFLLDPIGAERLFVLDDPLGGSHLHPEAGRMLERMNALLGRLPGHRKIIIAQSQDVLLTTLRRTQLADCRVDGRAWEDLGKLAPDFLERLWICMANKGAVPTSLKDRLAQALGEGTVQLEPGCLRHLAASQDELTADMSLEHAIRLAREPAQELGRALATDEGMEMLLKAVAIGSAPAEPIETQELAFIMGVGDHRLPGKRAREGHVVQIGGEVKPETKQSYETGPALDAAMEINLEKLERRGIVIVTDQQKITFVHPFYRAAAESVIGNPSARSAAVSVRLAERALFCLAPATSRASARNLDWLYEAFASRLDAQERLLACCVEGLKSIFPATRDLCFSFLLRRFSDLGKELQKGLPDWARAIAHISLDDITWENGEARLPVAATVIGSNWLDRYLEHVEEVDVSAEIATLESETSAHLTPEGAAKALKFFVKAPTALSKRAVGRLLSYDEAAIRAEAARIWLCENHSEDAEVLSLIFDDGNPERRARSIFWSLYGLGELRRWKEDGYPQWAGTNCNDAFWCRSVFRPARRLRSG